MRVCQRCSVVAWVVMGLVWVSVPAAADTLGLPTASNWVGHGSRLLDMSDPAHPIAAAEAPGSTQIDYSVSEDDPPTSLDAWAETLPFVLKGSIDAEGYGDAHRVGGYFRDELFLQSLNGDPLDVELQFDVTGSWALLGSSSSALLRATWISPDPGTGTFTLLSYADALAVDGSSAATGTFDTTLSLWSNQYGHTIASGMYLPTSITLYGDVVNASLDWSHTAMLSGINVYQGGRLLGDTEFTLFSTNGTGALAPFENRMPTPIGEPALLLLIGLSAFSAVSRLRRR